jgi:hypothetical protein
MTGAAATITLHTLQGKHVNVAPADFIDIRKAGTGALIEFWVAPEDSTPWASAVHVRETPGEVKRLRRECLAAQSKLGEARP